MTQPEVVLKNSGRNPELPVARLGTLLISMGAVSGPPIGFSMFVKSTGVKYLLTLVAIAVLVEQWVGGYHGNRKANRITSESDL